MSDESTTPDLVELTRAMGAARDAETTMMFFGPEPVWDGSLLGLGTYEGRDAVREFIEGVHATFEDLLEDDLEILDFGNGVVFTATRMSGSPSGGNARTHGLYGFVNVWTDGKASLVKMYPNIDETRAAAERLAEERG